VWPLQLLFHNIGWYLVYEEDAIGTGVGLIRSERIDRLALRRSWRGNRRSDDANTRPCGVWSCCCITASASTSAMTSRASCGWPAPMPGSVPGSW